MVTWKWISTGSCGHYEVSNGISSVTCDPGELNETIEEMKEELRK